MWILSENTCDFIEFLVIRIGGSFLLRTEAIQWHKGMFIRDLIVYSRSIYVLGLDNFF